MSHHVERAIQRGENQARARSSRLVHASLVARTLRSWLFGAMGVAALLVPQFALAAELDSGKTTDLKGRGGSAGATEKDIISFIDAQIRAGWVAADLKASVKATDAEWVRRAYLDLIGRIPTPEEAALFAKDPIATRKEKLIERLTDSDRYIEEYANNWATIWTNLLIGRPQNQVNNNNNPTSRVGMTHYLRRSFLDNKPYDQMVYELVSATGTSTPDTEDGELKYNGAVNFLVGKLQEDAAEATSRTARYFLGLQVQCTQCHNHPFNDWKQDQFWSFNAFFRQTAMRQDRQARMLVSSTLMNRDYRGQGGGNPDEAELFYELRNGTSAVAYPKFVDGTTIDRSGYVNRVNRREELAKLIVKSEYFGKTIVNRIWAHFLGYGFTKPVDDMGPHNAPSHPELLERLGKEFVANGSDLKKLMKWVMLSEAYSLSSKMTVNNKKDDPSMGEKPKFSHFYMRMMEAEQLYDSIETVRTNADRRGIDWERAIAQRNTVLGQFTLTFGNDEGDEATTFNGTIPQALMLMNGQLTQSLLNMNDSANILAKLNAAGKKGTEIVEYLFLATVGRKPSAGELGQLAQSLRTSNPNEIYQDVLWALINSNEFLFIY